MRFVKKVNERGVLTLPAEVREALGVEEGDIVEFEVLNVIKPKGKTGSAAASNPNWDESNNVVGGEA